MVLILSEATDKSTSIVIKWLISLGTPQEDIIRINDSDRVVVDKITIGESFDASLTVLPQRVSFNLRDVKSYWYRRGRLNIAWEQTKEKRLDSYLKYEIETLENFIYSYLDSVKYRIGRFKENYLNKLHCLVTAQQCGFLVPETLITTSKQYLNNKLLYTKPIKDNITVKRGENRRLIFTTSLLDDSFFEKAPTTFFPSLFQEYVEKKYELRIFFLNSKLYPMAIFSQGNEKTKLDFRHYDKENPNRTVPYLLPEKVEIGLLNLIRKLDLSSGSIDMIVTPDYDYVFLEVNPIGQFEQVSIPCNYYLEREIAKYLISYLNERAC